MAKPLDQVMPFNKIRIKTMCAFINRGKVLACAGRDDVKRQNFFRLIGGGLEFGETAEQGIRREVREELNSEIKNLEFIGVVQNIFEYRGRKGHQIVFLFKGKLEQELSEKARIIISEAYGELEAQCISCQDVLENKIKLYPEFDYSRIF